MKKDFPLLKHHRELHYLDNAATTQKPKIVIDTITGYLSKENANTHRGIYDLSEQATLKVGQARAVIAQFIGAQTEEIIFVRNTTEGMNQLANSLGRDIIPGKGNVVVTEIEHHSNFVPWQELAKEKKLTFKVARYDDKKNLLEPLSELIDEETRIVAFTAMSNVTGIMLDVKSIIAQIRKKNPQVKIVIDAAQAIAHEKINVQEWDCDYLCFSMHKLYGPLIGVVYGKRQLLESMHPFFYGGNMIHQVTIAQSTWAEIPEKFEAGTINSPAIIASAQAIHYLNAYTLEKMSKGEEKLQRYALKQLRSIPQVTIIGHEKINDPSKQFLRYGPVISFIVEGVHPHDLATICNKYHVCIRAGHHCCQPFMDKLAISATARISIALYTKKDDIDALIIAIKKAIGVIATPSINESSPPTNTLGVHTPN